MRGPIKNIISIVGVLTFCKSVLSRRSTCVFSVTNVYRLVLTYNSNSEIQYSIIAPLILALLVKN